MPREGAETALPVDVRNSFPNSVAYDAPVRTDALANQVVKQIAAYSAGAQIRPENYYLNMVDNIGGGNKVLQIRDKNDKMIQGIMMWKSILVDGRSPYSN